MARPAEGGCIETRTVTAFVAGLLDAGRVGQVARHLESCSRCAEQVAVASSAGEATTVGGPVHLDPSLPAGTRLGRYEVRRWIGRGGMGQVYEGFDPELERK